MRRTTSLLALGAVAALGLAAVLPAPAEATDPDAGEAIRKVMTSLCRTRGGVAPGTPAAEARKSLAEAAHLLQDHWLPLERTRYAAGDRWKGVVHVWRDPDTEDPIGTVAVALRVPGVPKKTVAETVLAVGKELGMDLEPDDDAPWTFWDGPLWVAIGQDLVVFELDELPEPVEVPTAPTTPR